MLVLKACFSAYVFGSAPLCYKRNLFSLYAPQIYKDSARLCFPFLCFFDKDNRKWYMRMLGWIQRSIV